jgi:hypothetical protein
MLRAAIETVQTWLLRFSEYSAIRVRIAGLREGERACGPGGNRMSPQKIAGTAIERLSRFAAPSVCQTGSASPFYGHGHRIAAAEAKGCNPTMGIAANHLIHQRHQHACATGPDRMAKGDRAAVYVDFIGIEA